MISIYSVEYAANLGSDCGTYSAQKQTYTSSTHNSRGNAFIYSEGTGRITVYPTDSTVKSFSWGETYASDTIAKEYGGSIQTYAVNLYRALCYQYTSETYSTQVADSAGHMLAKPYGVTIFNFYSKVDHSTSGGWTAACESCWSRGSFTAAGSGAIAAANLYLHISSHFETGTDGTAGRGGIISTTFSTTTLTNTLLWTTNSAGSMTAVTWDGAAFVTTQYSTVGTFLGQTSATTEGYTTYTTTTYISSPVLASTIIAYPSPGCAFITFPASVTNRIITNGVYTTELSYSYGSLNSSNYEGTYITDTAMHVVATAMMDFNMAWFYMTASVSSSKVKYLCSKQNTFNPITWGVLEQQVYLGTTAGYTGAFTKTTYSTIDMLGNTGSWSAEVYVTPDCLFPFTTKQNSDNTFTWGTVGTETQNWGEMNYTNIICPQVNGSVSTDGTWAFVVISAGTTSAVTGSGDTTFSNCALAYLPNTIKTTQSLAITRWHGITFDDYYEVNTIVGGIGPLNTNHFCDHFRLN